jgi:hypothetical protein
MIGLPEVGADLLDVAKAQHLPLPFRSEYLSAHLVPPDCRCRCPAKAGFTVDARSMLGALPRDRSSIDEPVDRAFIVRVAIALFEAKARPEPCIPSPRK